MRTVIELTEKMNEIKMKNTMLHLYASLILQIGVNSCLNF